MPHKMPPLPQARRCRQMLRLIETHLHEHGGAEGMMLTTATATRPTSAARYRAVAEYAVPYGCGRDGPAALCVGSA